MRSRLPGLFLNLLRNCVGNMSGENLMVVRTHTPKPLGLDNFFRRENVGKIFDTFWCQAIIQVKNVGNISDKQIYHLHIFTLLMKKFGA